MSLQAVEERLAASGTLDRDAAAAVWSSNDLVSVGMLADGARRARHGTTTTFVRVAEVSALDVETFVVPATAGEVRVLGSPAEIFARLDALRAIVRRAGNVPVTVGALEDFEQVASAGHAAESLRDAFSALRDTGVHGLAAAAVDRLSSDASLGAAVAAGLAIPRFTVQAPTADPWPLLQRVVELHRAWGAVNVFAPLATAWDPSEPTPGFADVKAVALARLVLRDVEHIQVDWSLYGPKLAQVALLFGADDLDAVSPLEEMGTGRRRAPLEEIRRNIQAASLTPVERDGRFGRRES